MSSCASAATGTRTSPECSAPERTQLEEPDRQLLTLERAVLGAYEPRKEASINNAEELGGLCRTGLDRDEYPPAVGRGRGSKALRRGINPVGWMASVEYVPSDENRSHGSTMGTKLRRFCDGQKYRYVF